MAKYDIRFFLRHAKDFIRQSGWTYNTNFTQNDKAVITATWDTSRSCISTAAKLIKDLKRLLATPHFDFRYEILHDGNVVITIDKSLGPKKSPHSADIYAPAQDCFTFTTPNHDRRKKDA